MQPSPYASNPFVLMTHPEIVLQAMEKSKSLARLQGQVYRPLDKPVLDSTAADAGDQEVDSTN